MIKGKTVLAVIPARGGSKRVPKKNLREFRGKPLFLLALEHADGAKYFDRIVVSTDDFQIGFLLNVSGRHSAYLERPVDLATDSASSEDVLRHALTLHPADWVVLLQPTSPLRTAEDIDACIERAQMGDGCISIDRSTGHPNGAIYVAKAEWIAKHDFHHSGLMRYPMDYERSLDIDTEADFDR